MLANFGLLALIFGLLSPRQVHVALDRRFAGSTAVTIIAACCLLAGFGIYLGRFLRWNSWDLLTRPGLLATDIADRFLHPSSHPRTWTFTVLLGGTILLLYWFVCAASRLALTNPPPRRGLSLPAERP